jgi:hypothetical protein
MKRLSTTEYSKIAIGAKGKIGITTQAVRKRIKIAVNSGTNKLKDGSHFEKIGHNYIIEIP